MPGEKILVVDDEVELVKVIRLRLKKEGYEIITAYDGEEGINKAKENIPDLMLLDIMMPKLSGHEVCGELKSDEKYKGIKIIIVTAKGGSEDERMARRLGADDYVTKPFSMDDLLERISVLLKN